MHPLGRCVAVAIALSLAATAGAYQPYQYGFESTSPPAPLDWTPYIGNPAPTQSGGGVLGLTAPQGNYYYESVNQHDAAFGGYGASGYSSFGIPNTDGDPNYTAGYAQSIQIYIDPTNWAPGQGFAVDGSPGLAGAFVPTLGNVATNYQGYEYNDETQIQISVPHAGLVSVDASPGGHIANITSPGWYTFVTEFEKSAGGPTAQVENNFGVLDPSGHIIGSVLGVAPIDNQPAVAPYPAQFQNQMLGGANYIWLVDWQNGFANDVIGIDNIKVGPAFNLYTPEPSSFVLLGIALASCGAAAWRRRKA